MKQNKPRGPDQLCQASCKAHAKTLLLLLLVLQQCRCGVMDAPKLHQRPVNCWGKTHKNATASSDGDSGQGLLLRLCRMTWQWWDSSALADSSTLLVLPVPLGSPRCYWLPLHHAWGFPCSVEQSIRKERKHQGLHAPKQRVVGHLGNAAGHAACLTARPRSHHALVKVIAKPLAIASVQGVHPRRCAWGWSDPPHLVVTSLIAFLVAEKLRNGCGGPSQQGRAPGR